MIRRLLGSKSTILGSKQKGTKRCTTPAVERPYTADEVERLRGSVRVEHTLARLGAERLRELLATEQWVAALGALTGGQAVQMVKAGLQAIYLSGWQVAADAQPRRARPTPTRASIRRRARRRSSGGSTTRSCAPTRSRMPRAMRRDALAGADRRRRRGRLRRPAERVRADEGVHRGRRRRRPLRGPALLREEVRPPRRQGARAELAVRAHARRRAARGRRARRADAAGRAHRRARRRR